MLAYGEGGRFRCQRVVGCCIISSSRHSAGLQHAVAPPAAMQYGMGHKPLAFSLSSRRPRPGCLHGAHAGRIPSPRGSLN